MIWRFAASTGCCVDQPVLDTLDALHEAGIDAVEFGTPPRHFDLWCHDQVVAIRDRIRHLGIKPIAIHAPFGGLLDLTDPNSHHRHAAIGAILSAASALREIGGSRIVVHVSDVPREGHDVDGRLAYCTGALRILARACSQMDMTLVVETPLPHLIGGHPDEFASVLSSVDRTVGVCFDTSHTTLGHHWDRFVELAGDRLIHVHANDHRGHGDEHLSPGEGVIDWVHIRDTLVRIGFEGWIVLELSCPPGSMAAHFAAAVRRARELFSTREQAIERGTYGDR